MSGLASCERIPEGKRAESWPPFRKEARKLKTVSLFSGCGGSDFGAKQAGADVVFAIDISPNAVKTYWAHRDQFAASDSEIRVGDVRSLDSLPNCDLLIGCYPCQSFSMGGRRAPENYRSASLYLEFARCLEMTDAQFAIVENVAGLAWLHKGRFLRQHLEAISSAGRGYVISHLVLNAKDYGVPADRRRLFLVAVRRDLGVFYHFPTPSHGPRSPSQIPWSSHGEAISQLPADPKGEYYTRDNQPFSWWYMSRNRKRQWDKPSYAILGNWRHTPLHPASPKMRLIESKLSDGWKQTWEFTQEHDHMEVPDRVKFDAPRRLSWRECAVLQTFPDDFEPYGSVSSKFTQIGNAVPPLLMKAIVKGLMDETALLPELPHGSEGAIWIP